MELNRVVVGAGGNTIKDTPQGAKNDILTQNEDGSVGFKPNTSGSLQAYNAEGGTVAPPSSGKVRWDNVAQASATKLFVSTTNANGDDLTNFFSNILVNDALYIQSQGDSNKYQYWGITAINNQPSYSEYDVILVESIGGDFSTTGQGENLIFRREQGGLSTYNYQQGISGIESSPTVVDPAFNDYIFIYDQSTKDIKTTDFSRISLLLSGTQRLINTGSPSDILATDGNILFDTTSTAININLPSASIGKVVIPFKDIGCNSNENNITINRVGSDTITDSSKNQTSTIIATDGFSGQFLSNGVDTWYLL